MTRARTQALLDALPPGLTEMYFHPAVTRDATLMQLMPDYEHEAELDSLLRCKLPIDVALGSYGQFL